MSSKHVIRSETVNGVSSTQQGTLSRLLEVIRRSFQSQDRNVFTLPSQDVNSRQVLIVFALFLQHLSRKSTYDTII